MSLSSNGVNWSKESHIDEISEEFDELLASRLQDLLLEIENSEKKKLPKVDHDMIYPT